MTGTQVIDRVREHLSDVGKVRWIDITLLSFLQDAVRLVYQRRPDLLLGESNALIEVAVPAAIGDTIVLPESFREALEWIVAGRALAQDSHDQTNMDRAASYLERGEGLI
jgi:hypothetical protein